MNQLLEQAKSLLKGAYDLHLHAALWMTLDCSRRRGRLKWQELC